MNSLLPILLAFGLFFLYYRFAIRRILLDRLRFKIFSLRDDLRDAAINGDVDPTSFAYLYLERSLCALLNMAPLLTIYNFSKFVVWNPAMTTPPRELKFKETAPESLLRMDDSAIESMFWVLLINSPLGAVVLLPVIAWLEISARMDVERKAWLAQTWDHLAEQGREFLEQKVGEESMLEAA